MNNCLFNCLAVSFGNAVAFALISLVSVAIAGLLGLGPIGAAGVAAAVGPILLAAGLIFVAAAIACIVLCAIAAAQAAPAAGAPGGAQQGLEEEDDDGTFPHCWLCRWFKKYGYLGAAFGIAGAYLLLHGSK